MKSGSNGKEEGRSGKPPHWRRREHGATTVYVVHTTEFRTVVQQLTGAAPPQPPVQPLYSHEYVGGGGGNGAGTRTNAQAPARHGGGEQSGGSRGRTLGQMHQDLLAWANADDDT